MPPAGVPLAVDLDGTLVCSDTLHESLMVLVRDKPRLLLQLPVWLIQGGKAGFKAKVTAEATLNVEALPLNDTFVDWLREEQRGGRPLVLATAANEEVAKRVAAHVGVFNEVLASNGDTNLAGATKAETLVKTFGKNGYDYAGNSNADVDVWRHARRAVVVNPDPAVEKKAAAVAEVEALFPAPRRGLRTWLRMVRAHQWLKNVLVALPLLAAHQVPTAGVLLDLLLAFVSLSMCASAVYILNDLLDLESDRLNPHKRTRPLASGAIPIWVGVIASPLLFAAGLGASLLVNAQFAGWLLAYTVLTTAYSFGLKRVVILDAIVLSLLYTLRVVAGAAATQITPSFWLLALCVFLFLSLAFLKRFSELRARQETLRRQLGEAAVDCDDRLHGRGYRAVDTPLIQLLGVTAGMGATLVLAMYIDGDSVFALYRTPEFLWAAIPAMVYWLSWLWLKANRGEMHHDPVVFAVKEKTSLAAGAVVALAFVLGSVVSL